jgi:hypothetical protein
MLRAFKAAFLLRWPVNGLGDVPVNVVALACLGVLGFGNPAFWFVGVGLETVYLATLATNRRFIRWIAAQDRVAEDGSVTDKLRALTEQLTADDRRAMERLNTRCRRIEALWRTADEFQLETNQQALRDLEWFYMKLLIARQHLQSADAQADAAKLAANIKALEREVADPQLAPPPLRESKTATLAILRKRAENLGRRQQSLEEIASDLARIEAQVDLVLENTTLEGKPQAVAVNLDLASQTLDSGYFGASAADVADVDAAYSQAASSREKA